MTEFKRTLAAFLAMDIVGYSGSMDNAEEATHAARDALVDDILTPLVEARHGNCFKTMGDGFFCEFGSAVASVQAAVDIQRRIAQGGSSQKLRIGAHFDDVIVGKNDFFGRGVNLTARLEGMCPEGGVCISERVYEAWRGSLGASDVEFKSIGFRELKNIKKPVEIWVWEPAAEDRAAAEQTNAHDRNAAPVLRFIAEMREVLPRARLSRDSEYRLFDHIERDLALLERAISTGGARALEKMIGWQRRFEADVAKLADRNLTDSFESLPLGAITREVDRLLDGAVGGHPSAMDRTRTIDNDGRNDNLPHAASRRALFAEIASVRDLLSRDGDASLAPAQRDDIELELLHLESTLDDDPIAVSDLLEIRDALEALRVDLLLRLRQETQVFLGTHASALPVGAVFQTARFAPEMVVVPSGRFWMGSPEDEAERLGREGPRREVEIRYRIAVGRYAVTFSDYLAFCAAEGHESPDDRGWGRELHPVINVSWEDAQAYLAWLNGELGLSDHPTRYRLLSESEWEYCCRAGTDTPFSFGETITTDQANYHGNFVYGSGSKGEYRERPVPVGSLPANAWGLYEMHGNVWEWVEDRWHGRYQGAPLEGSAWTTGDDENRVLRGGSWDLNPRHLRSAYRFRYTPDNQYSNVGFRVSRTLSH